MKTEYKIFAGVAGFLFAAAALYGFWTHGENGEVEWIGLVALILSGLLCTMCGTFFWFVSRRIDLRPEDREDGEIAEGAGEIGFFSPGSYWPFWLGLATLTAGVGIVFWFWWIIGAGIIAILIATGGLLFEYYVGVRKAH